MWSILHQHLKSLHFFGPIPLHCTIYGSFFNAILFYEDAFSHYTFPIYLVWNNTIRELINAEQILAELIIANLPPKRKN